MPLNTDPHLPAYGRIELEDWQPSVRQSARAAFQHSLELNPTTSARRVLRYIHALDNEDHLTAEAIADEAREWEQRKWRMSRGDQQAMIDREGLAGQLEPDENYDEEILADVITSKREANARKIVQSKDGWKNFLPNLAAGLAGGMLDPINLVAAAVPIVPAGVVGGALRSAAGPLQRAMIYAGSGAVSGAVGTAALEPLIYTGQKIYQADFDCAMSLQNIALGALMASGFHSLFGSAGDALRNRRGLPRWWERLEPTEASERARQRLFAETAQAYRDAGTALSESQIRTASKHASDIFDGWARETAYHADVPVEQLYREYQVDIRSGEIARRKLPGWDKEEYYRLMEEQGNNYRNPQSVADEAFDAWVARTLLDPENTLSSKELKRTYRFNPLTEEIERRDGRRFAPMDKRWKALEEVEGETLYAERRSETESAAGDSVAGGPPANAGSESQTSANRTQRIQTERVSSANGELVDLRGQGYSSAASQNQSATNPAVTSVEAGVAPNLATELIRKDHATAGFGPAHDNVSDKLITSDYNVKHQEERMLASAMRWFWPTVGQEGKEMFAREYRAWGKKVAMLDGKLARERSLIFSSTPLIFELLKKQGFKTGDKGIEASVHFFNRTHPSIDAVVRKQAPLHLADPVAVFESATHPGEFVFMTAIPDKRGANVVVPITLGSNKNGRLVIKSIYGKTNMQTGSAKNAWFLNEIKAGRLLYADPERLGHWASQKFAPDDPILAKLKIKKGIPTRKDLLALREENPALFQRDIYGEVQGAIRFNAANTQASIRVMRAADVTTGPHEMVHAIRRFTETLALKPHASYEMRLRYERQCEYVGATPGQKWTRAQEEKLAEAYLKFLWDGTAPSAHLAQSFEDMNAEMRKVYCEVQWRGLEVSPQLARMFERINRVPLKEDLARLRCEYMRQYLHEWERDLADPSELAREFGPDGRPLGNAEPWSEPGQPGVPRGTDGGTPSEPGSSPNPTPQAEPGASPQPAPEPGAAPNPAPAPQPQPAPAPQPGVPRGTQGEPGSSPNPTPQPEPQAAPAPAPEPRVYDGSFREPTPEQILEQSLRRIEELDPELARELRSDARDALAFCEAERDRARTRAEVLEEYLSCAFGPLA